MGELQEKYYLIAFHYGYSGLSRFLILDKGLDIELFRQMLYEAAYNGKPTKYPAYIELQRRKVIGFENSYHEVIVEVDRWDRLSNQDLSAATCNIQPKVANIMLNLIFTQTLSPSLDFMIYDLDGNFSKFRKQFIGLDAPDPYALRFVIPTEERSYIYENALRLFHSTEPYYRVGDLIKDDVLTNMTVFTLYCMGKYMHIFAPKTLTRYELVCALQNHNHYIITYPPPLYHSILALSFEDMMYPLLLSYDEDFPLSNDSNEEVLLYINSKYLLDVFGKNYVQNAAQCEVESWAYNLLAQALLKGENLALKDAEGTLEIYQGTLGEIQNSMDTIGALEARYKSNLEEKIHLQQQEKQHKSLQPKKKKVKIEKKKNVIDDDSDDDIMHVDNEDSEISDYDTSGEDYSDSGQEDIDIPSSDEEEIIADILSGKKSKKSETYMDRTEDSRSTKTRKMESNKDLDQYVIDDHKFVDDNNDLYFIDRITGKKRSEKKQIKKAREHFNTGTLDTYLDGTRYVYNFASPSRSFLITLASMNPYYLIHILVPGPYEKKKFIDELLDLVRWHQQTLEGKQITPKPITSIQISNVYLGLYSQHKKLPLLKVFLNAWELFDMTLIDNFWSTETFDMILSFLGVINHSKQKFLVYHVDDVGIPITKNIRETNELITMDSIYQQTIRGYTNDNIHFVKWKLFLEQLMKYRTMNQDRFNDAGDEDVEMIVGADDYEFKARYNALFSKDPDLAETETETETQTPKLKRKRKEK